MKHRGYGYIPVLILFWLLSFELFRFIFYLFNSPASTRYFESVYRGFATDVSATCYLMLLPLLFWLAQNYITTTRFPIRKINFIISAGLFVMVCFIEIVSLPLYVEWGTTFNLRALVSAESPGEAIGTFFDFVSLKLSLIFVVEIAAGISILYFIHRYAAVSIDGKWVKVLLPILVLPLLLVGIRGGIGKQQLRAGSAFYSHNQTENYMAVNKTFYFLSTLRQMNHLDIEDVAFLNEDLMQTYKKLYTAESEADTTSIFTLQKPNVVLIILEGCPAELFEPLGGSDKIAPRFSELSRNGLLFTQIYASGFRTDQGLLNVLSGLPALPYLNIMTDPKITDRLPSVLQVMKSQHYSTTFIYGGDASFSKFRHYFEHHQTDAIIDKDCFDQKQQRIRWGVPDDEMFERVSNELQTYEEPFFTCILTLSTHTPFDIEGASKFPGNNIPEIYKSSVYFTDSCIGNFIDSNRNASWYKNTVFIIVSDHGSMYLGTSDFNDHERFRIPLLIFGEPLKEAYRGKIISNIGGSNDLAATLLKQLNADYSQFVFSKNLLSKIQYRHAYWITDHAMGWITSDRKLVFNFSTQEIYYTEGDTVNNREFVNDGMRFYKMVADYTLLNKAPK